MAGRRRRVTSKRGRERHKPEVADLGLLGHWQQQQKQQKTKGKLKLPNSTPARSPLSPLGSPRGRAKTSGSSSPRGQDQSKKKSQSKKRQGSAATLRVDLEPMNGRDPGVGEMKEG